MPGRSNMAGTRLDVVGTTRPRGSGSVFLHKGRYWSAVVELPPGADGKRRRRWVRATSQDDAERLAGALVGGRGPARPRKRLYAYRLTATQAVLRVLERGRDLGWDDEQIAPAIVASLARSRLLFGVIGACVYCGDELANSVDHVDPSGGDGPENVVSACGVCNTAKGKRTPQQWREAGLPALAGRGGA